MKDLGFLNNINFIGTENSAFNEIVDLIESLPVNDLQIMAEHLQDVVSESHSLRARASQLAKVFVEFINGTFYGAGWSDGTFEFFPKPTHE
jgi:hypothetical protein